MSFVRILEHFAQVAVLLGQTPELRRRLLDEAQGGDE